MATWSLCGRHAGPDKNPDARINQDNVLTVERQGDLTAVVMVGGETVYIDTRPETLIGVVPLLLEPLQIYVNTEHHVKD